MSQTTDSQPQYRVISFRVKLNIPVQAGEPYRTQLAGNESATEASNFQNTRSTFIPGISSGGNYELKHGDTFTVSGLRANYLKRTYANGSADDILEVVSET